MAKRSSIDGYQKMTHSELSQEIAAKRLELRKMRMGITLMKEKNSGKYRLERRELARMMTALHNLPAKPLKEKKNPRTVPAS